MLLVPLKDATWKPSCKDTQGLWVQSFLSKWSIHSSDLTIRHKYLPDLNSKQQIYIPALEVSISTQVTFGDQIGVWNIAVTDLLLLEDCYDTWTIKYSNSRFVLWIIYIPALISSILLVCLLNERGFEQPVK